MCENPFFPCKSTEPNSIAVTIHYKEKNHQICQDCWNKIDETDLTWESKDWETAITIVKEERNPLPFPTKKLHTL